MTDLFYEVNFDGIVGPTHNYAGLSLGNMASTKSKKTKSYPKKAALQGLEKMMTLSRMGLKQAVLPPVFRPIKKILAGLGFTGDLAESFKRLHAESPALLYSLFSSSNMWTANAGTICPSVDSLDGKVHFTAANLSNKYHRALEADFTSSMLKQIFANDHYFVHHDPLYNGENFGDEGAANHTRFCLEYGRAGLQLFSYGKMAFDLGGRRPCKFPARQSLEASRAIARLHQIKEEQLIFAQTKVSAIDGGIFHNDVISVGNRDLFFYHEYTFENQDSVAKLQGQFKALTGKNLRLLEVRNSDIPLEDVVKSYLFNSQLISIDGKTILVAPQECKEIESVKNYLFNLQKNKASPINDILYFDLRESMKNGGGPACLRLRVVLSEEELNAVHPYVFLTEERYLELKNWIHESYRDEIDCEDLLDLKFLSEVQYTLEKLSKILNLEKYPQLFH